MNPFERLLSEHPTALLSALATLGVLFLLFLLTREVWCWYWKLNSLLGELRLIRGLLERAEQRDATAPSEGPTQL